MVSEAQKKANAKYAREKVKAYTVRFYPKEMDLWEQLQKRENKTGYIKELIRRDLERS